MVGANALVVLFLALLQVSQAQYVMTTYYQSQGCSGTSMSYLLQPLNLCIYMGGTIVESTLFKQDNSTTYSQFTYTTTDCSGDPAITMPYALNTCADWGGSNGVYFSGSYMVVDSPVVPSIEEAAYQVSVYPSCDDTSLVIQRYVFNPSYCYPEATGTSWMYESCNATSVTKNEYTGTTTCNGGSMTQVTTPYKGCLSIPYHSVQECYVPNKN